MNVALLGHGTVGTGVDTIMTTRTSQLHLTRVLTRPGRECNRRDTSDFNDILNDTSIELVAECLGGLHPAREYILAALQAKKHVVTANKAVVATYLDEFVAAARAAGVGLYIEASCGGGIPWLAGLRKIRRIDDIQAFSGILNGTSNYIIDQMTRQQMSFEHALAQAQERGYAEADPSSDIDGYDTAYKTVISAAVAFDALIQHEFPVRGIRTLTLEDIQQLETLGLSVRLMSRAVCDGKGYAVSVEPCILSNNSLEAQVPDNFNIASATGATIGRLTFYGQGAGSLPTGNAMVQDMLDCMEGRVYDITTNEELSYEPTLLASDYLLRTTAPLPRAILSASTEGIWYLGGFACVPALTAQQAADMFDELVKVDPTSFMAAIDDKVDLSAY